MQRSFHVLLVGTDEETERRIRIQLIHPYYQITPHRTFNSALEFVEKEKFDVDLVLSDVSLKVEEGSNSFEDGYDFIEQIQLLKQNIPHVVIFGAERLVHHDVNMAYKLGACYFLQKPISEGSDEIGNLWKHVFRWRAQNDGSSSLVSSEQESLKRGHEFINHGEEPSLRKQRMVWTEELNSLFVEVVNYLGKKDAVPKRILKEMNMRRSQLSLTREQVGSHLQKHWEKEKKKQLPQRRMNNANGTNVMTVNQIPPRFDIKNHVEQHLALQPMMFNNYGAVTSLIRNGSNNLISEPQPDFDVNTTRPAMHQPDRITSSKSNMPQQRQPQGPSFEGMESNMLQQQHLAIGTSFRRSNMQQQSKTQNLTSSTQQLGQNPSSVSGIRNQDQALGTSFENSNMEQQLITQNLISSMQQPDAPIRSDRDGMITAEATGVDDFTDLFYQRFDDVLDYLFDFDIFPTMEPSWMLAKKKKLPSKR